MSGCRGVPSALHTPNACPECNKRRIWSTLCIVGSYLNFPEIFRNFPKFRKFRKFREISRNFAKFREISIKFAEIRVGACLAFREQVRVAYLQSSRRRHIASAFVFAHACRPPASARMPAKHARTRMQQDSGQYNLV